MHCAIMYQLYSYFDNIHPVRHNIRDEKAKYGRICCYVTTVANSKNHKQEQTNNPPDHFFSAMMIILFIQNNVPCNGP